MSDIKCPECGSHVLVYLGVLGTLTWLRCRQCGMDVHTTEPIAIESDDMEDDE